MRAKFLDHLIFNYNKNKERIKSFFSSETIYSEFWIKIFNYDEDFKSHTQKEKLIDLWKSWLDVSKIFKNTLGIVKKNSTIKEESNIYTKINEDAYTLLKNIKASDDNWDIFNEEKKLERLRNKVFNRELSLWEPKQREYNIVINRIDSMELCKMDEINEDCLEENKEELDSSYDRCEDADNSNDQSSIMVKMNTDMSNDASLRVNSAVDKSTELPQRRTFLDFFNNDTTKLSRSVEMGNSSIGDKITRVTTTSPSQFSRQEPDFKKYF